MPSPSTLAQPGPLHRLRQRPRDSAIVHLILATGAALWLFPLITTVERRDGGGSRLYLHLVTRPYEHLTVRGLPVGRIEQVTLRRLLPHPRPHLPNATGQGRPVRIHRSPGPAAPTGVRDRRAPVTGRVPLALRWRSVGGVPGTVCRRARSRLSGRRCAG